MTKQKQSNDIMTGSTVRVIKSTYCPNLWTKKMIGTKGFIEKINYSKGTIVVSTNVGAGWFNKSDVQVIE